MHPNLIPKFVWYIFIKLSNESWFFVNSEKAKIDKGSTKKNIRIPLILWVIDKKADNGSFIFNRLMFIGLFCVIKKVTNVIFLCAI